MFERIITVGILSGKEIEFSFPENFLASDGSTACGMQKAVFRDGKISWQGRVYDELSFSPAENLILSPAENFARKHTFFELKDVTIGIHFHWERRETQRFQGTLRLIVEDDRLTAVNVIAVEDYLVSVISSEMSATASLELLKAHAVISRSWVLSNLRSHPRFDVCADDHCQRYQGITRASTPQAAEAVAATRGEVLTYNGEICDARYSKCCGGAFEEFQNCWENVPHPYLVGQRDSLTETTLPDLTQEAEAEKWIRTAPAAFCNTHDGAVLGQVLNNYDQETTDFYRWTVSYTQQELSELIHRRSGIDFGQIIDLIPVQRGTSGRLVRLKIVGTRQTAIIGKELEIRRTLSPSHLYSAAFVVDKEEAGEFPSRFTLTGAGWGHGVGLCQIGAAVMGAQGYNYKEILAHYYPGSIVEADVTPSTPAQCPQ